MLVMIAESWLGLIPALLALLAGQPGQVPSRVSRMVVNEGVIWRVPVAARPPVRTIKWIEHKGPRCVAAATIRRAFLYTPEQVDFLMSDRSRIRARFNGDCAALDFYAGLYLRPEDGFLCAKRDAVHSRMGASCAIAKFRLLEPRPIR